MKVFIAEGIEVAEVELVANGYEVSQRGACEYARKLWKRCAGPARNRQNQLRGLFGSNYRRNGTSQVC